MLRLSSQKSLYCYFVLSTWIFILIAGMYKYIGKVGTQSYLSANRRSAYLAYEEVVKLKKYQQDCNHASEITRQDDGGVLDGWKLQGVLLLIRHGDRGPMSHVRGIDSIDCSNDHLNGNAVKKYKAFLSNGTVGAANGQYLWSKSGPFHNFPLLPASPNLCLLGQLTYSGIAQLLEVGNILRQVYGHQLNLVTKSMAAMKASTMPNISQSLYPPDEIIIYSTRYRRTFQSAMALMYAFVSVDRWMSLIVQESHSLSFCFADCACPFAETLKDQTNEENARQLNKHPTISAVVQWIGHNLLQNPTSRIQPLEVRDAILFIMCHNAPLPCRKPMYNDYHNDDQIATVTTTEEPTDLINIDQDDSVNSINRHDAQNEIKHHNMDSDTVNSNNERETDGCVEASHVTALLSYTNWQSVTESKHKNTQKQGLLRAYGLMRNMVSYMLKIVSGAKTKFVLYSGHDRTTQFVISALGLYTDKTYFIPYASRLAFEIYKSDNDDAGFYFRLVFNGKDVTRQIHFCEGGKSLRINRDSRGNKADLCPIENIIRFIHEDFFTFLNATNLKDACNIPKNTEM